MNNKLQSILKEKPYLAWDVNDVSQLSEKAILEHIINYGDWDDIMRTISILGVEKAGIMFEESIAKTRNNYRPQTINLFKLYFKKHAQGDPKSVTD